MIWLLALLVGSTLSLETTGYTHTGNRMANGRWPAAGRSVACRRDIPLGTVLVIPGVGVRRCEDRIGHSSELDVFYDTWREARHHCGGRGRCRVSAVTLYLEEAD